MLTLSDLRPGDVMAGPIGGVVPGLFPVAAGQLLLAPSEARRTLPQWWNWRHAAVVVSSCTDWGAPSESYLGWKPPKLVQAMPSGAEEIVMTYARHWTGDYFYIRPAYEGPQWDIVAYAARRYVGRPYSFADYAAIAAHRLRYGQGYAALEDRDALARYVADSKRMICSQLVDQALTDAGWHTFTDGRLPQDVMPAELACALLAGKGWHLRPGESEWTPNDRWPGCCSRKSSVS
jgi:hypothetical protein